MHLVKMPEGTHVVNIPGAGAFEPDENGVFAVQLREHVTALTRMGGVEVSESAPGPADDMFLLGTNLLPAIVQIGDQNVQLGTIVASVHAETGLTASEWNRLPERVRDLLIVFASRLMPPPAPAPAVDDELGERPNFASFASKTAVNDWLVANNGTPLASGSREDHDQAASDHWDKMVAEREAAGV